jgi:hypothetical protein
MVGDFVVVEILFEVSRSARWDGSRLWKLELFVVLLL